MTSAAVTSGENCCRWSCFSHIYLTSKCSLRAERNLIWTSSHPLITSRDEIKGKSINEAPALNVLCDSSWFKFLKRHSSTIVIRQVVWRCEMWLLFFRMDSCFQISMSSVTDGDKKAVSFLTSDVSKRKTRTGGEWIRPEVELSVFKSWDSSVWRSHWKVRDVRFLLTSFKKSDSCIIFISFPFSCYFDLRPSSLVLLKKM